VTVDVHSKLDELLALVSEARSMPMSASCILNRAEVLTLLDEMRELLPEELHHAETVLEEREAVVAEGRREAERLIEDARAEQARLVSQQEVVQEAHAYAVQVVEAARAEAERVRVETDEYVDAKLAGFEVALTKTLAAVTRGREKLARRAEEEAGAAPGSGGGDVDRGYDEPPLDTEVAR
jgi:cell division septum initiation protein DivIVA